MSMRLKSTVLIFLIISVSTMATFFSGVYFTNNSLKETMEQDLAFAIGIADSLVSAKMNLLKTEAATIAGRLSAVDSAGQMTALLKEQFNFFSDISGLSVFDRNGVIASHSVPEHDHDLLMHREFMERVYNGHAIITSPFYCSTTGEFVMNVYAPVDSGRILAMTIPGLTFSDMLAKHRLWQTGDIFMLNEVGTFIGAVDQEFVLGTRNYTARDRDGQELADEELGRLIEKILSVDSGVDSYRFEGRERLCAYSRIDDSTLGWRVAVTVPIEESPQADALKGQISAAAVFLTIGVMAAFFLARLTAQPFKKIEDQNRSLEKLNETIRAQAASILEEHERVKLMLDATPLASRLWTRDFKLLECNEAAVKLFGLKSKREYMDRYFELSPEYQPDGQRTSEKIKRSVVEAFEKGECTFDWMYHLLDGTPLPSEVSMVRVPYGGDYVVAAYSRDLREQKKMLLEIEQRDALLQTVNEAADILLRSEPDEFEDTLRQCMGMMARAVTADRISLFKNTLKDGRLYCTRLYGWSEDACQLPGADITARVSYDEHVPAIKELLSANECCHGLVGDLPPTDRAWLEAQGILSVVAVPVFIRDEFWGFVGVEHCRSERLFTDNEISIMRSGGLLIANALLRNEYTLNIRDTSSRLAKALADAEEANKSKSDFLASISHEMRTPLNAIIGLSEIALDSGALDVETRSNLEKIYHSGSTLLSITNDLLDISKVQAGKFVILENPYDVPSLVNDAMLQNVLRIGSKPVRFILDIDESLPAGLCGDELRVKQVINNLLSNAIKYTEAGTVELGLRCEREGDTDAVWLNIRVADTGIGLRPEHLERLFTHYMQFGSTAGQQAGGTGLGLAITRSLAELMGGSIAVESRYGEGSVFTVRLRQRHVGDAVIGPGVVDNLKRFQYSASKLKRHSQVNRVQLPYARVLVVDDNITNLDVARGLMKPYAMQVDCVMSGQEAVRAVRREHVKYDAIFMDHMMPEMDGIEATRIIREEIGSDYARSVPIIALTANAIAGNEEMFLNCGFQSFISKPVDLARLDEVIRRFIRDKKREERPDEMTPPAEKRSAEGPRVSGREDGNDVLSYGQSLEGVNLRQGLERYGDEAALLRILRSYAVNTGPLLESIRDVNGDRLAEYGITVHGLKGASRNICAEPVSVQAEALERAAKAGDADFVARNNPGFVEAARKLVGGIEGMLDQIARAHPKPKKEKPEAGDLLELYAACERYDFTAIDAIMENIERYEYTSDDGMAAWLQENITKMNFAQVMEKLSLLRQASEEYDENHPPENFYS